jgi:hypothetical protein
MAGSTTDSVSVRLFVTATERAIASQQAKKLVLLALQRAHVSHYTDSAEILAVDPMAEFEGNFPAPK